MNSLYVFDSSIWIRFARNHPKDIFVSLWERIDQCVTNCELISPDEVADELEHGIDDLAKELKMRNGLFVPLDEELQLATADVLAQCPSLADPDSDRNRADPFVVALAKIRGGIVVTEERPRKVPSAPMKIPDACRCFAIDTIGWFEFLRAKQWRV
jgi:hypothetical protein